MLKISKIPNWFIVEHNFVTVLDGCLHCTAHVGYPHTKEDYSKKGVQFNGFVEKLSMWGFAKFCNSALFMF